MIQAELEDEAKDVLVDTADRFQGQERALVWVCHPLSGQAQLDAFLLDPGRLCLMLSRHRVGCILVGRKGIAETLRSSTPLSRRAMGQVSEKKSTGTYLNTELLNKLANKDLIFS